MAYEMHFTRNKSVAADEKRRGFYRRRCSIVGARGSIVEKSAERVPRKPSHYGVLMLLVAAMVFVRYRRSGRERKRGSTIISRNF